MQGVYSTYSAPEFTENPGMKIAPEAVRVIEVVPRAVTSSEGGGSTKFWPRS
jgi:hypothetical protein